MMFANLKQSFTKTTDKIGNIFIKLLLIIVFFAIGALAALFIKPLMDLLGIYACIIGGVVVVSAFLLTKTIFSTIFEKISSFFGKKRQLTKEEQQNYEKINKELMSDINKTKKQTLDEIQKNINKKMQELEYVIFGRKVSKNIILRIISDDLCERDRRIISAYLKMQRDFLCIEYKLRDSFFKRNIHDVEAIIKNFKEKDRRFVQDKINDLMQAEEKKLTRDLLIEQQKFKINAIKNYKSLYDYLLGVDIYGQANIATEIHETTKQKMIKNGYCPLISDNSEYRVFWHYIEDYEKERDDLMEENIERFSESVIPNIEYAPKEKQNFLKRIFQSIRNFFSKKNKKSNNTKNTLSNQTTMPATEQPTALTTLKSHNKDITKPQSNLSNQTIIPATEQPTALTTLKSHNKDAPKPQSNLSNQTTMPTTEQPILNLN